MRLLPIFLLLALPVLGQGQTSVSSILIKYGYIDLPADQPALQMMFGSSKMQLYCDENYLVFEQFQEAEPGSPAPAGGMPQMMVIQDHRADAAYMCLQLDTLRVRMTADESKRQELKDMILGMSTARATPASAQTVRIAGYDCQSYGLIGEAGDTVQVYTTAALVPAKAAEKYPLYLRIQGAEAGFMLGKDEQFGPYTVRRRAIVVSINEIQDIEGRLKSFRLVSEEEINKLMREWMQKQMGEKH